MGSNASRESTRTVNETICSTKALHSSLDDRYVYVGVCFRLNHRDELWITTKGCTVGLMNKLGSKLFICTQEASTGSVLAFGLHRFASSALPMSVSYLINKNIKEYH